MLFDEGKYPASEKLHRRALKVDERVLGIDHPDTLNSVAWLGRVLQDQGKLEEAGQLPIFEGMSSFSTSLLP